MAPPMDLGQSIKQAMLNADEIEDDFIPPSPPPPPSYNMFDQMQVKTVKTAKPSNPSSFISLPLPPPMMEEETALSHIETEEYEKIPSAPPLMPPPPQNSMMMEPNVMNAMAPPPSFHEFEQHEISDAVTSPTDTERLVKEQSEILEQLERENAANDAAIAAAATSDVLPPEMEMSNVTETTTNSRPITKSSSSATRQSTTRTVESTSSSRGGNTISIGPNTRVTLRGEEQTRKAIDEGTAMIVQCVVCRNWMQVANTATLMFCPTCSTVSRAEKQTQITTIEEARLLMAHKRRKERKEEKERKLKEIREMSWGQYVKSYFVTSDSTRSSTSSTRAASSSSNTSSWTYSGSSSSRTGTSSQQQQQQQYDVQTYGSEEKEDETYSRQRLLPVHTYNTESSSSQMAPGRVAEKRPLHSCFTELTKTLTGGAGFPGNRGQNNDIDGIDSSALLSVTRVGRQSH